MQPFLDLTGRPAGAFGAKLGRRISWQAFRSLTRTLKGEAGHREMVEVEPHRYVTSTAADPLGLAGRVAYAVAATSASRPKGCPIPPGAVLRGRRPRPHREPPRLPIYWLGRKARFAKRYTDPACENRGFPKRPSANAHSAASKPIQALLRPLSATTLARTAIASVAVPEAILRAPAVRRNPFAEEAIAGRISARHVNAADWFTNMNRDEAARSEGMRSSSGGGEKVDCSVRDPLALWPVEAAADRAIRLRWRFRTLGPLARIVWRALQGSEMAELAPAWQFPQRHKAEAGRIRLRAGLELCARMAEREVDRLPLWEVLKVAQAACTECTKLEATRRMRVLIPANDNTRQHAAA
jgi:hypothetical protein